MLIPATSTEIAAILGEVGPLVIEQIEETRATASEVASALALVRAEREGIAAEPMSLRIAAVRAIIEDAFDDLEEEPAYPAIG